MITDEDIQSIAAAYKEEGLQEGLRIGEKRRAEDKVNTAKKLIALGVDLDIVSKATGIPVDECTIIRHREMGNGPK